LYKLGCHSSLALVNEEGEASGACADGACDIVYGKSPTSVPLGNNRFVYIEGPIRLEILLSLNKVKNLLVLI